MVKTGRNSGPLKVLMVRRAPRLPGEDGPRGHVKVGALTLPCALGRAGTTHFKREGDRATPVGRHTILYGYYRPDRMARPPSRIPLRALPPDFGWCDDPASPIYNRPRTLPIRGSHEVMWRDDGLYDLVFVLDYNMSPRRSGRGSAIFLHCAQPGFRPTLGCVALRHADMRRLLPRLAHGACLIVI